MIIIGLVGKKRSGKDTVAGFIKELYPMPEYIVVNHAHADSLKGEIMEACGVSLQFIEQNKDVFRPMLQWWGTDFRRGLYSNNYWIDRLNKKIVCSEADILVVTDVRFHNEAKNIKEMGGYLLGISRLTKGNIDYHPSETELETIHCDHIIKNDGSLTELKNLTSQAVANILQKTTTT